MNGWEAQKFQVILTPASSLFLTYAIIAEKARIQSAIRSMTGSNVGHINF